MGGRGTGNNGTGNIPLILSRSITIRTRTRTSRSQLRGGGSGPPGAHSAAARGTRTGVPKRTKPYLPRDITTSPARAPGMIDSFPVRKVFFSHARTTSEGKRQAKLHEQALCLEAHRE